MAAYEMFIGLEIHIHLLTKSKVFCGCSTSFGDPPNTHVCPVCLGYPGVLPAVNQQALKFSYMVGVALNCRLSEHTVFERKNYFYPDMTKNYQISQFSDPVGLGGHFDFESGGSTRRIRIHDIHLEEDAGKMIHEGGRTLLDYNRAGSSLLEIVTEPDFRSAEEAEDFLQEFRRLVRYLGVCDGNMEEGSLRCDANISINTQGSGLGTKVEIKNLNSSRFVRKALNYEYARQSKLKRTDGAIVQETRLWDDDLQRTQSMRTKEAAHDYRYFPEPDIPPFMPSDSFLQEVHEAVTELPFERAQRYITEFGLNRELVSFIIEDKERADFFEATLTCGATAEEAAKWLKGEVAKQLGRREGSSLNRAMTPERLAKVLVLLAEGTIHANIARQLIELILDEDDDPEALIEHHGLLKGQDDSALSGHVDRILAENPKVVRQYLDGNQKVIGFLMGQVMKATGGSIDPARVREEIVNRIGSAGP